MAHGRTFKRSVLSSGVVAGVLALAACTSPGGGGASEGNTASSLTRAELDLLTRSGDYTRDEAVLYQAETKLIAACMTDRGFRYKVDEFVPSSDSYQERQLKLGERRTEGYGLYREYAAKRSSGSSTSSTSSTSSATGNREESLTNDQYVAQLPAQKAAAYMRALRGGENDLREMRFDKERAITFSEVGCEAESRKRLFGELDDWAAATYIPQNLNSSLTDNVTKDAKYTAAIRGWKKCMAERGYHYRTPDEAAEQLKAEYQRQGAAESLRRREIDVAVADGTCAERLHIPSVVLSLRKQYAGSLPEADRSRLRQAAEIWTTALGRTGTPD
ncbi:hypothetical protein AB0H86_07925 [Streptomyces sp. NPDC050997]|uniref:hypothetical protein n=1 Tax=Streptomyces sp. NPDC050997 TaxID=3155519 RepID=UPI0034371E1C